jgi:hypothetical protein
MAASWHAPRWPTAPPPNASGRPSSGPDNRGRKGYIESFNSSGPSVKSSANGMPMGPMRSEVIAEDGVDASCVDRAVTSIISA